MPDHNREKLKMIDEFINDTEEVICTCPGVEEAAKKAYRSMIDAGAPKWLAGEHAYELMAGDWVHCKCEASKTEQ